MLERERLELCSGERMATFVGITVLELINMLKYKHKYLVFLVGSCDASCCMIESSALNATLQVEICTSRACFSVVFRSNAKKFFTLLFAQRRPWITRAR